MPRIIDRDFHREVELPDGAPVRLRLVRPTDRQKLADGVRRLSPQSRYSRFLSATGELSEHALRYLTELDQEDHLAIAAFTPATGQADEQGLGVARYVRLAPGSPTAEVAVTVLDDYQRRGLGSLLVVALIVAACERGVERFHAEVLSSNQPVLELLRQFASSSTMHESSGVVTVDMVLPRDWREQLSNPRSALGKLAVEKLHLAG